MLFFVYTIYNEICIYRSRISAAEKQQNIFTVHVISYVNIRIFILFLITSVCGAHNRNKCKYTILLVLKIYQISDYYRHVKRRGELLYSSVSLYELPFMNLIKSTNTYILDFIYQ